MPQTVGRGVRPGNVNVGLWWFGWRPVTMLLAGAVAGLVVGNAVAVPILAARLLDAHPLAAMGASTAVGGVVGLLCWYAGAREINAGYADVIEAFERGATGDADAVTYALIGDGEGSTPLVEASERYDSTYLVLDSSALRAYDGRFDLVDRRPALGDGIEVPYDRVASVDYDGWALVVETAAGDTLRYAASEEPTAALADLRARLA